MNDIGIERLGICVPRRRLAVTETIAAWKNTFPEFVGKHLGVTSRTVLASDEDVLTLATEAARQCLTGKDYDDVDGVFVGTSTSDELHRGTANALMGMLTERHDYLAADVSAAERSGTAALLAGLAAVTAGQARRALVVGADVMNRRTAPGDLRESYEGAGAGACTVGPEPILTLRGTTSINSDFPAFGRTADERFVRPLMPIDSGTLAEGLTRHLREALMAYQRRARVGLDEFAAFVLPQAAPGQSLGVGKSLGIPQEKIAASLFAASTGDTGSAAPLIGLARTSETLTPGDRVLVCSYGTHAGVDVLDLEATERINAWTEEAPGRTDAALDHPIPVTYAEALRLEYKLASTNLTLGAFN